MNNPLTLYISPYYCVKIKFYDKINKFNMVCYLNKRVYYLDYTLKKDKTK